MPPHSLCRLRPQSDFLKISQSNKYICCSEGRMTRIFTLEQAVLPSVVCYIQSAGHRRTHTFWKRCLATDTHSAVKVDAITLC